MIQNNRTNSIQKTVNELYLDTFSKYEKGLNLSVPCIPRISDSYLKKRLVIVGQETNTWYKKTSDDLFEVFLSNSVDIEKVCLIDRYDKFIKYHASNYGGNFWRFSRLIHKEVYKDSMIDSTGRLSHIWINLFAVEACSKKNKSNGRPTKNHKLADKVTRLQGNLLFETLAILEPEIVVFLTGHTLDNYLKKSLSPLKLKFKPADNDGILTVKELAEITIEDGIEDMNFKMIRAYHPTYFMGYINGNKSLKKRISKIDMGISNQGFYTENLIKKITTMKE